MSLNDGILAAVIWPTYVGVLTSIYGAEPDGDYHRGQISWHTDENGEILGHATILVPKGFYTHLCYFHHPTNLLMVGHQQLAQPFDFKVDGVITVDRITKADFTQLPTHNGFRLPV